MEVEAEEAGAADEAATLRAPNLLPVHAINAEAAVGAEDRLQPVLLPEDPVEHAK